MTGRPRTQLSLAPNPIGPLVLSTRSAVCELTQMIPDPSSCPGCTYLSGKDTCENSNVPGWCYVEGQAAGQCQAGSAYAIKFGVPPAGQTMIQCIQQTGGAN